MAVKAKAKTRASKAKPAAQAAKEKSTAQAAKGKSTAGAAKEKSTAQAAKGKSTAQAAKAKATAQVEAPVVAAAVETDPVWIKAREDYADHAIKVADIAERLQLSRNAFLDEVKKRGWPLRTRPREKKAESASPKPVDLLQHVFGTIKGELQKLDSHKGTSSQDRERASRALSQMVNSLEKAVEMQREISKTKTKGSKSQDKELAHAEDLRRAIAERLERLNSKRDAGKRS